MRDERIMRRIGELGRSMGSMAKKCFYVSFIICGLFILHPSSFILASPRATVRVNAESTARSDSLTLGDIADVQTSEPQLAIQLRAIGLGYAPQVGAVRELTKQKIALAISAAGFSSEAVGMESPAITLVRREAQTVEPALVRQAVERSLIATLRSPGAIASLTRLDLPPNIEVPTGLLEVRASVPAVSTLFSPFSVSIEFWVDGRLFRRRTAIAQAQAFASVLVAARDLGAKARLREGDFKLGEAITADALVADIVVKPGDPVRIVGQSGALSVLVMGEARAAGHVGDRIQVKNLQSGLLFPAVIVDEGLVSVRF
jgi:hypothetical protein